MLIDEVVAIVRQAAHRVLDLYDAPSFAMAGKADGSPLTAADLAAQETITAGLRSLSLKLPILSEEAQAVPFAQRRGWEACWLVDPLDGTREFIDRNGEFTVNVALVRDGRPVLGVVCAPALGMTYWAARGHGAFAQRDGSSAARIGCRPPAERLRVVVSRSHETGELGAFLERLGPCETLPMGSSLKICRVAQGLADLYPRLGTTCEWDTAAAHCILEEAGGLLTDPAGHAVGYNKEEIHNPPFFAAGSVTGLQRALAAFAATNHR